MKKQQDYIENLKENIKILDEALSWLKRSYTKCSNVGIKEEYSADEFDIFETLTSRYARVVDILIHKVFRSIDSVELVNEGTMIDVINRSHKRGLFENVDEIRQIKDLRNEITHEYVMENIKNVFNETFRFTPKLFNIIESTKNYCETLYKKI
ncbi:MAG: hypothetical protein ACLFVR_12310 [Thiohalospira sp.]